MPKFRPLKKEDHEDLIVLLSQLVQDPSKFDFEKLDIDRLIESPHCHCIVIEHEKKAIGFGALSVFLTPTYGYKGKIEDIIIHEKHRGKGLGKKLMQKLLKIAKDNKIKNIHLTSNPKRIPARKLYESLGFKQKDTGIFVLDI